MLESLDISLNPVSATEVTRLVGVALAHCQYIRQLCLPMEVVASQQSRTVTAVSEAIAESGRRDLIVKAVDQSIVVFSSNAELEIPFFQ